MTQDPSLLSTLTFHTRNNLFTNCTTCSQVWITLFQIACFQFHADFEQISQKMDIKIAYMARGNSTLIFAKITSLRFASGDSIFHSTGGGIWYEKILPKKISPLFWWTYFDTIHWLIESTTFIPNSKEEEKSPKRPKIWLFFPKQV